MPIEVKTTTTFDSLIKDGPQDRETAIADFLLFIAQTDLGRKIVLTIISTLGVRAQIEEMQGWDSIFALIQDSIKREDLSGEEKLFLAHCAHALTKGIRSAQKM